MRRQILIAGLAASLLASVIGTAGAQAPDTAARIAGALYIGDAPTVIAEAQGFFSQQGIDAETVYLDSGKQSLARLRAGEADFALTALTPVVVDRLADETPGGADDPVIIASLVHSSELLRIVTTGDVSIRRPSDFHGKRIAINRGTNTEFVWWLYEQYHGLDRSAVELVDLSFAQMPEALESDRVHAALLSEPGASNFEAQRRKAGHDEPEHIELKHLYAGKWVIAAARSTVRERNALCRKLLRSYQQAIDFIERAPGQAVAIYSGQFGRTAGDHALPWNALAYDLSLDWSLIAGLQEQLHWARLAGYGDAAGSVGVLELLEPGPLLQEWPGTVGIPVAGSDQAIP